MSALIADSNSLKNEFTVISTFSGGGGSSTGYKMAGGKILLAVEWDDNAVETYRANYPNTQIFHGDINDLSVEKVLELTGLKPGELDILDGSPPCQGFSTAGKRDFCDDRNQLFRQYVRLLRGLKPKVFVMENVSGMIKGDMKLLFAEILTELKQSGYKVSAKLLNAMYFGVPQSRERMIFIGIREDLGLTPIHPKPFTKPITFKESCYDLRGNSPTDKLLPDVLLKIAHVQPHNWNTDIDIYTKIKGNTAGSISLKWALWDRVCGTLPKSEISITGIVHPDRERYISLSEAKRIGSFPDNYWFKDRKTGIERIGNAVPPLLMKAIAETINKEILSKI